MSRMHSAWRVTTKAVFVSVCLVSSNNGQPPVTTYVCQTPTFWCAFTYASGMQNGTLCYCGTLRGVVYGYSVDPRGMSNAPPLPTPQRKQQPSKGDDHTPQPRQTPVPVGDDDCYKGLGNCPGSFVKTAPGDATKNAGRPNSGFGAGLQKLIEAARDSFSDVQGKAKRSSSTTEDKYGVTVTPEGMEFCTLFIPSSRSRRPWVSCFAPDEMSYSQLLNRVSGAIGTATSRSSDGQVWSVADVEIEVSKDPVSVDIRLANKQ
jgi:hypothetical protein